MRTAVGLTLALVLAVSGLAPAAVAATAEAESCRTIPVDADAPLRADIAREEFGVDGSGVKVGILSDSFALTSAAGATVADDIANGLLPGPGNPCGYETPVELLREGASGNDEGRAMLQLVHGIAPGATLFFVAVDEGLATTLVDGIDMLVKEQVDIIIDDVEPKNEPAFQRSLAGEAIVRATEAGIAYFSAAGNGTKTAVYPLEGQTATPINGWETSAYRPMTCPDGVSDVLIAQGYPAPLDCLDVNPGEATDATLGYRVGIAEETALDFHWGEPLGRVSGLFVPVIAVDGVAITTPPTPMQDGTPGFTVDLPTSTTLKAVTVAVARVREPDATTSLPLPPIYLAFNQHAALATAEYWQSAGDDTVGRTIVGHNGDPAAISVGAAPYTDPLSVEPFSSFGPLVWAFGSSLAPDPSRILEPRLIATRPDLLSVDRVRNSVLGTQLPDGSARIFGGTSAAAPNAGAVAALILSYAPGTDPETLRTLLTSTATPAPSPWDFVTPANVVGAGLIDAEAALAALPPRPTPTPTPEPTPTPTSEPTPTASTAPTATPAATAVPAAAGPSRLATTGMDTSSTLPLLLGAIGLLILGAAVLLVVRARARRR